MGDTSVTNPTLLQKVSQLVHASLRPLPPRYGDGKYNFEFSPPQIKTGILKDLASQAPRIVQDIDILVEQIVAYYRGGYQDDSKYFVEPFYSDISFQMEKFIQLVCSLPSTSKFGTQFTDGLITNLWNCLRHPPLSYVGDHYQYRTADGSCNVLRNHVELTNRISCILTSEKPGHHTQRVCVRYLRNTVQNLIQGFFSTV